MTDDPIDDLDLVFSGIRLQLKAWLELEVQLGDRPFGWAFDMHAEHMGPRHELAELRRHGGDPAMIELLGAIVDECDRLLAEQEFDSPEVVKPLVEGSLQSGARHDGHRIF